MKLAASVLVAGLALAGCSAGAEQDAGDDEGYDVAKLGVWWSPGSVTWDPANTQYVGTQHVLWHGIYETLFLPALDGGLEPGLVSEWEYAPGNTELTLTLEEGVTFTDGEEWDAAAAKANLEYWQTEASATQPYFASVSSVEVVNDRTLLLRLSAPTLDLITNLSYFPIASPATLGDPDLATATPVGSGPYILDEERTVSDVKYTVVRNPDYRDPDKYSYDEIEYVALSDLTARLNALKSGEVDGAELDTTVYDEAVASGFTGYAFSNFWMALSVNDINGEMIPALGDRRVRQAMAHAFDRQSIIDALVAGIGTPSAQLFAPGQPEYLDLDPQPYEYDPAKANELMAEAGYADGFDLVIPARDGQTGAYEAIVQQSLAEINIRVTYEQLPEFSDFWTAWQSSDYPVFLIGNAYTSTVPDFVRPDGLLNPWKRSTPEVSSILSRMDSGTPDESAEASAELGAYLLDEMWMPSISQLSVVYGASDKFAPVETTSSRAFFDLRNLRPATE
ncbi:ABC transporter substrate-binding protein [Microbacterium sp. AGC85]